MRENVSNLFHWVSGAWMCLVELDVEINKIPGTNILEQQRLARAMRQNVSNLLHATTGAWLCLGELDVEDSQNHSHKYS